MRRAAVAADLTDDQTLLPTQFYRPPECGPYGYGPGSGPRRLMVAVLVDALRLVVEPPQSPKAALQQAQARDWLWSDSSAGLFSFRRICTVLELDPGAVRHGIDQVAHWKLKRVYASHRQYGALHLECAT